MNGGIARALLSMFPSRPLSVLLPPVLPLVYRNSLRYPSSNIRSISEER